MPLDNGWKEDVSLGGPLPMGFGLALLAGAAFGAVQAWRVLKDKGSFWEAAFTFYLCCCVGGLGASVVVFAVMFISRALGRL